MNRICLLMTLALTPFVVAQEAKKVDAPAIEEQVGRLNDDAFKTRQEASNVLMRWAEENPKIAEYLKRHVDHEDPEVRARIAGLIKVLPATLVWQDPKREKEMKSRSRSPDQLKLTVKNRSKTTITVYWVDWEGKRQPRRSLKPGEQCTYEKTYREHVWLIADANGKGLGIYVPGGKDAQIIYTGREGK